MVDAGELEIFTHSADDDDPAPSVDVDLHEDNEGGAVVAVEDVAVAAVPAPKHAAPCARAPEIPLSDEMKALLENLGYNYYGLLLERAGVTGLQELRATTKGELVKMGILVGHAAALLQQGRRPDDATRTAKVLKSTTSPAPKAAPKPAPKAQSRSGYYVGAQFGHTRFDGSNVCCTIVKLYPDGFVDISYDVKGKTMVKPRVPRSALVSLKP